MKIVKLSMIEREVQTPAAGGEDDAEGFTVQAHTGAVYVNVEHVRSLHERINAQDGSRNSGTRIAFNNGSNISVTEDIETVADRFTA